MQPDDLQQAEEHIKNGELDEALAVLNKAWPRFKKADDIGGLRSVVGVVERIQPHLSGKRQHVLAKRIAYGASQNISYLERRAASGAGHEARQELVVARGAAHPVPLQEILPATPLDALSRKTREAVEQGLLPGEPVRVAIQGAGAAAIVGTDRRAFIHKRGFLSGATFGQKLASFAYENIVGVEVHTGALTGAVVIHVPGAASVSTSYWQNSKSDPHKAYNAIPIARPYAAAQAGAAQLRALISEHSPANRSQSAAEQHAESQAPVTPDADVLETLRRLGELRDAGVLTPEEFETKKAEWLARL